MCVIHQQRKLSRNMEILKGNQDVKINEFFLYLISETCKQSEVRSFFTWEVGGVLLFMALARAFPLLWVNIKCRFQMGTGLYVLCIFVYISKCSIYTAAFVLEIFKYKILDGKYWYGRNFLYSSNSNLINLLKVLQLLPLKTHTH